MNEYRPKRSLPSTLSKRKDDRAPFLSRRYAETGVIVSASIVSVTGTMEYCSANVLKVEKSNVMRLIVIGYWLIVLFPDIYYYFRFINKKPFPFGAPGRVFINY